MNRLWKLKIKVAICYFVLHKSICQEPVPFFWWFYFHFIFQVMIKNNYTGLFLISMNVFFNLLKFLQMFKEVHDDPMFHVWNIIYLWDGGWAIETMGPFWSDPKTTVAVDEVGKRLVNARGDACRGISFSKIVLGCAKKKCH